MIQTFPLGATKTITLVPAVTLQSNVVNWEASRQDGNKYEVLLSFGLPSGQTQWITLFSVAAGNYKRNPTDAEIVAQATIVLNL